MDPLNLKFPASYNPWQVPEFKNKILFVGGIPKDCTMHELHSFLQKFDEVLWQRIELDYNGVPKGYAYAIFKNNEGYDKILNQRDHMVRDLKIGVSMWKDPKDYLNEKDKLMRRKVFVKRLNSTATDQDLYNYFSQFGKLEKTEIRRSHYDNTSRRIGFVIFEREEDANKCLDAKLHVMNGREIICKQCKNTTEARKEKLNRSGMNEPFDNSQAHSYTLSNDSSWLRDDSGSCSVSANTIHFKSANMLEGEEQQSFYHPGSMLLNNSGKANASFSYDWKREIVPIEEKDEPADVILTPFNLGSTPQKYNFQPFYPEEELEEDLVGDYFDQLTEPQSRKHVFVNYYTFPGYVQRILYTLKTTAAS